jgi:hypothetical protein
VWDGKRRLPEQTTNLQRLRQRLMDPLPPGFRAKHLTLAPGEASAHNRHMVVLEAVIVIGLVGMLVFWMTSLLLRSTSQGPQVSPAGRWRVAHYDVKGETRVVLQKVREGDTRVIDEHMITSVRSDDPEYDDKFLAAMNAARQRQALFEAEDG